MNILTRVSLYVKPFLRSVLLIGAIFVQIREKISPVRCAHGALCVLICDKLGDQPTL